MDSNNIFVNGVNCYELIDSIYVIDSFDGWDCSAYSLNEYFNVRVFIGSIQGIPAPSHEFWIIDGQGDSQIDGETSSDGYSKYIKLINKSIDPNGYQTLFNPYDFYYLHNSITTSVEKEIFFNQTVSFYLDTLPPQTEIYGNGTLVNSEIFYLMNTSEGANPVKVYVSTAAAS